VSKIGVIFVGYGTRDLLDQALAPWITIRKLARSAGLDSIHICAVSVKFAGFEGDDDGTGRALRDYWAADYIDHVIYEPDNIPETTARGMALAWLKDRDVDLTWMVDSDEWYTVDQIGDVLRFVDDNPFAAWFKLSLANYVFDDRTRLVEPFTPPRIHRVKVGEYEARGFSADNDVVYSTPGDSSPGNVHQDTLPSMTIPESVAAIKHLSWLNDERSKCKVEYQQRRWGHCSFAWDDAQGGLIFNPALPRSKVMRDEPSTTPKNVSPEKKPFVPENG